jgi:hypothetical protein
MELNLPFDHKLGCLRDRQDLATAPPPPAITCDMLKDFTRPTLVMRGEKTREFWALPSKAIAKCVPGGSAGRSSKCQNDGPYRDPAAFTAAVFEFFVEA